MQFKDEWNFANFQSGGEKSIYYIGNLITQEIWAKVNSRQMKINGEDSCSYNFRADTKWGGQFLELRNAEISERIASFSIF